MKPKRFLAVLLSLAMMLSMLPANLAFADDTTQTQTTSKEKNVMNRTVNSLTGSGAKNDPYLICNLSDLEYFRDAVNGGTSYEGLYIKLMDDIDMTGFYGANVNGNEKSWDSIGGMSNTNSFKGTFNGGGHEIKNLYIKCENNVKALFGYLSGTVENLGVSGSVAVKQDIDRKVLNTGGLVGWNAGVVRNCYNLCNVSGDNDVGGIAGINYGTIENCYNLGNISGNYRVGSIVGIDRVEDENNFKNCYYKEGTGGGNGTSKNETEFASGEVAWLLQNGQSDKNTQVWGQNIGTDTAPVLTSETNNKVHKVAFMKLKESDESSEETQFEEYDARYVNNAKALGDNFPANPDSNHDYWWLQLRM